jgi:hypothetical protein
MTDRLYFMKNGDANVVKIGRAGDVEARRGQFKTGNPEDMTVVDVVEAEDAQPIETVLHRLHYSKRLHGEFYGLTPAEVEEVGKEARDIRDLYVPMQQEVKRLAQSACDSPPLPSTEEHRALRRTVIEKREAKYRAEFECDLAEFAYKTAIGTSEGIEGDGSWKTVVVPDFDEAAFRQAYEELYGAFVRPRPQRRFRVLWS